MGGHTPHPPVGCESSYLTEMMRQRKRSIFGVSSIRKRSDGFSAYPHGVSAEHHDYCKRLFFPQHRLYSVAQAYAT